MFPLYKNDGKSLVNLTQNQKKAINIVKNKIISGKYKLVENGCLCGNDHANLDIIIAEKDRYGLPVKNVFVQQVWVNQKWTSF